MPDQRRVTRFEPGSLPDQIVQRRAAWEAQQIAAGEDPARFEQHRSAAMYGEPPADAGPSVADCLAAVANAAERRSRQSFEHHFMHPVRVEPVEPEGEPMIERMRREEADQARRRRLAGD